MKLAKITEKQGGELTQFVLDQQKALAGLVIDMRTKKVTNVKEIAAVKRSIAQALTIQRQREIAQAEQSKPTEGEANV